MQYNPVNVRTRNKQEIKGTEEVPLLSQDKGTVGQAQNLAMGRDKQDSLSKSGT